jgi:signal peptidase II
LRTITRVALVILILVGCVGCDQITKGVIRSQLPVGESYSYLHDMFRLTHAENPGAFLGLGDKLPEHTRAIFFTWGVGILSLAPLLAAFLARGIGRWHVIGLALFAAGGLGNLIDRITEDGRVTDFLNVGLGQLRTGIFNVADMTLMVGVVVFLIAAGATSPAARSNARQ